MTRRSERGAGTILALGVVVVVVAAAYAVLLLATALSARHRAAAVADLAALAAADSRGVLAGSTPGGSKPPAPDCRRAEAIARANAADLVGCRIAGDVVEVSVRVRLPPVAAMLGDPVRRARAGAASAVPAGSSAGGAR